MLFRRVARRHGEALKPYRLSAVDASILVILWERGSRPVGELQRELGMSSSTITDTLDRMEVKGLIDRVVDVTDRRVTRIQPREHDDLDAIVAALLDTERRMFAALGATDRRELVRLLQLAIASADQEA